MTDHRDNRETPTGDTATNSYDEPGAGGGYCLSERFEELKEAMKRADFHGHLETSQLRAAVVEQPKPRSKQGRKRGRKAGPLVQPAESKG